MMSSSLQNKSADDKDPFSVLRKEIEALETEVEAVRKDLAAFEAQISAQLGPEMARLRELQERYKKHKQEKKAKRLEQKKRGKNWVEPQQLRKNDIKEKTAAVSGSEIQAELKRLYKGAVAQVHPDKIAHVGEADRLARAHALTVQLNGIYQRGDLEELILFYQQLMLGDAGSSTYTSQQRLPDSALRLEGLKKKKAALVQQLQQYKNAFTYQVLTTYENPLSFIEELHHYILERIQVMEKRTRKL